MNPAKECPLQTQQQRLFLLFKKYQQSIKSLFFAGFCAICQTVKYINYYAGIFFLTAMSIDRYVAVVYSTKSRQVLVLLLIKFSFFHIY